MPDPLDFDGARRALDDVPAPDLWADASQRAEAGAVVPLPAASGEHARRPRWLVAAGVAAVAVLAVGTAAALLADDDQSVETTPDHRAARRHRRSHDRHRRRLHRRHHRRTHRDGPRSRRGSAAASIPPVSPPTSSWPTRCSGPRWPSSTCPAWC